MFVVQLIYCLRTHDFILPVTILLLVQKHKKESTYDLKNNIKII